MAAGYGGFEVTEGRREEMVGMWRRHPHPVSVCLTQS